MFKEIKYLIYQYSRLQFEYIKQWKKKRSKEERKQRVKDDLTSINEIEDDKEAHQKNEEIINKENK